MVIVQHNIYDVYAINDYDNDDCGLNTTFALSIMSYTDHSPSAPVLNYREYEKIHGRRPFYDTRILSGGNDGELWRELNSIAEDISESEKEIIISDAKKVYGVVPVKLAVSLYAHGYPVAKILSYLKEKEIEMTAHRLYSLCYQYNLRKVRQPEIVPFEQVLPLKLFPYSHEMLNVLKKEYYEEYAKAIHEPEYMGKKNFTVARLVMKQVLQRWGLA